MKIALLTVYSPAWLDMVKVTIPNWLDYCAKAGYNLIIHPKPEKTERFYGWLRIEDLYELLMSRLYDAIVLLDADLIFTNHTKIFETLMDDWHDFYITCDVNGLNAGVTIWKRTEATFRFLDLLLSSRDNFTGDQDAIAHHFGKACNVKVLPQGDMNSYVYWKYGEEGKSRIGGEGDWKAGDFILHLPALPLEERIKTFSAAIQQIVK